MKSYQWCDFDFDSEMFPDALGYLKRLKERGLRISVWINPYIAQASPLFEEGKKNGYFIKVCSCSDTVAHKIIPEETTANNS